MLLTQHSFATAKPMNCEEHQNGSSDTHIMQRSKNIHHQSMNDNSHYHTVNSQDSKHRHGDEVCEKCKASDCVCCEGGFCSSFHLNPYLVQAQATNGERDFSLHFSSLFLFDKFIFWGCANVWCDFCFTSFSQNGRNGQLVVICKRSFVSRETEHYFL